MSEERIEISESAVTKIASVLATVAPIALGVLQYVNDPNNLVGLLICVVLFVSLVLWRMTQQTVREQKADIIVLRKMIEDGQKLHVNYAKISSNTVVNMFAHINRLSGERDAGSITLDPETGASVYVPPPYTPMPLHRRIGDAAA